jgi:hypothetical protein
MKIVSRMSVAIALAFGYCAAAPAHHSFGAEFDRKTPVTLEGTATKIEWENPHTRIYLDVPNASGPPVNWELELGSPNGLLRAGWTRHSLQVGEKITVKGFQAKDGSHLANASSIVANGKLILSESKTAEQVAKEEAASPK